jgi:pimeloyl-ACP methyl ester carboxylesterase
MPANPAFLDAESQVFAKYALDPKTRELQLDKPTLTLRGVETGAGEPVLFLHGFGLTTAHWAPLLARLPSLHCFAIDMPGHGASDGMDYGGVNLRDWFTNMLTSCLDRIGVESAHIVGHSQGAMIGMWLALDAPERVRSLVAIGTPAVAFSAGLDSLRFLARPVIGRLLLSMPQPESMYRSILERTMGRHALDLHPELVRPTYLATHRPGYGTTVSTYLREMFSGAAADPQRYVLNDAGLARIHRPVIIVWGEDDNQFQPIAEAKTRAAHMPNARFELVTGGHEPWLDELDAPAAAISDFLSRSHPVVADEQPGIALY